MYNVSFSYIVVCMLCVFVSSCALMYMVDSEDNFWESILAFIILWIESGDLVSAASVSTHGAITSPD